MVGLWKCKLENNHKPTHSKRAGKWCQWMRQDGFKTSESSECWETEHRGACSLQRSWLHLTVHKMEPNLWILRKISWFFFFNVAKSSFLRTLGMTNKIGLGPDLASSMLVCISAPSLFLLLEKSVLVIGIRQWLYFPFMKAVNSHDFTLSTYKMRGD